MSLLARFDLAQTAAVAHKSWRRDVLPLVATLVQSLDRGCVDQPALQNLGITAIVHLEWSPSPSLTVLPGWRWFNSPGVRPVDACLAKKHEKLHQYRRENGDHFQAYWLAITGYGVGVPDHGFSMLREGRYVTEYNRVFLVQEGRGTFVSAQDVTPAPRPGQEKDPSSPLGSEN